MGSKARVLSIEAMAGLLLFIAITGVAALVTLGKMRAADSALRSRFIDRNSRLQQIRGAIYLSGTLARDYFLDPTAPDALAGLQQVTLRNLGTSELARLRAEVLAYFQVVDFMIEVERKHPTPAVDSWFRRQLVGRRAAMLELADTAQAVLDREWQSEQWVHDENYARFRQVVAGEAAVAFALGLVLAILTQRRMAALEEQTRGLSQQLVAVQEEERRSIARELHDEVGQALNAALLEAGTGPLRARLQSAVASLRRIALALRPSMLDDLGLVPALEWQAREIGNRTGLDVQVDAEDSAGELSDSLRTCIFRVAQEALHNCVRHANAKRVRVELQRAGVSVALRVEDDGRGFAVPRTRGLGLLGMEERVTQLGGRFHVTSHPGRGTVIRAELPLMDRA
jgi:signal transduction histidine kinase